MVMFMKTKWLTICLAFVVFIGLLLFYSGDSSRVKSTRKATRSFSLDTLYALLQMQPVSSGNWGFEQRFQRNWDVDENFEVKGGYVLASKSKPENLPHYIAKNGVITVNSFSKKGLGLENTKRMLNIFGTLNVDSAHQIFQRTSKMLFQNNIFEINSWLENYPNTVTTFDSLTFIYGYTLNDTIPSEFDLTKVQYSSDSLFWIVQIP